MKVELVKTDTLKPYELNPRINKGAVDVVAKSIQVHGFNQPIVVDQNMVICVGHTRWLAAQKLKMDSVPVVVKQMGEDEFIAYNIADNKTKEYSSWDNDLLKGLIGDLAILNDGLLDSIAFLDTELEVMLGTTNLDGEIEDDPTPVSAHTRKKKKDDEPDTENAFKHKCPSCSFEFN